MYIVDCTEFMHIFLHNQYRLIEFLEHAIKVNKTKIF